MPLPSMRMEEWLKGVSVGVAFGSQALHMLWWVGGGSLVECVGITI